MLTAICMITTMKISLKTHRKVGERAIKRIHHKNEGKRKRREEEKECLDIEQQVV
jgi:hypothetical protein